MRYILATLMLGTTLSLAGCTRPADRVTVDAKPTSTTKNIFISQLETATTGKTIAVYSINPETLQAQALYTIPQPSADGYFADGPTNLSAANDTVQWADGGAYAIVRFNRSPGIGTTLPPYYQAFYRFDPITQTMSLVHTTDHDVLPGWLLGDGMIYFLQSSKVIGDNIQERAELALTTVNAMDGTTTSAALSNTDLQPYEQDALIWNEDQTALLWVGKEADAPYVYTYHLGRQTLSKQSLTLAPKATDTVTSNLSHQQDRYASTGFFSDNVQLYNLATNSIKTIPVGDEINNEHLYFSNDDKKLFVSTGAGLKVLDLATLQVETLLDNGVVYRPTRYGTLLSQDDQLYLYSKGSLQTLSDLKLDGSIVGITDFQ